MQEGHQGLVNFRRKLPLRVILTRRVGELAADVVMAAAVVAMPVGGRRLAAGLQQGLQVPPLLPVGAGGGSDSGSRSRRI